MKREGDEFEPEGAGRLSEGSDTLVRASRSRDFVRATSRGLCLSNGVFRSNSFDSTIHRFRVPFHSNFVVIYFFLLKRKIFHYSIIHITCLLVIEGTFEIRGFVFTFGPRSKERTNCISLRSRVLR